MWDTPVLVRGGGTTTYHFGLDMPICEKRQTARESEPQIMSLREAVDAHKRLCQWCAGYIGDWAKTALLTTSQIGLINPPR